MTYKDKEAQKKYQREWLASRRKAWLKENGPCVKCGSFENLEIDHKDPSKKISHNIWSWSKIRRNTELCKCQVLCSVCHNSKTVTTRKQATYKHGGERMYRVEGCRCSSCRVWKSKENAKRKLMGWV